MSDIRDLVLNKLLARGYDQEDAEILVDSSIEDGDDTAFLDVVKVMLEEKYDLDTILDHIENNNIVILDNEDYLYEEIEDKIKSIDSISGHSMVWDIGTSDTLTETIDKLRKDNKILYVKDGMRSMCLRDVWEEYMEQEAKKQLGNFQERLYAGSYDD